VKQEVTETIVDGYYREVPHKYRKGLEVIPVKLDAKGEAELTVRNKTIIIRVVKDA
jgi:hypothetical protein